MRSICSGKGVKVMKEKKFHIISIAVAYAAIILVIFTLAAEGMLAAVISLVLCSRYKETHRVKIGVVLSIIAILAGILLFALNAMMYFNYGVTSGYWLFDLITGT